MSESDQNNEQTISFKVDAGLVDRLGRELVGRAETAVSELIKNAYDADAKEVEVNFIDTNDLGGTLTIKDDGQGMSLEQLRNGFMTISSTDKVHNPTSEVYKRNKAGRKGIGRFATQRLGSKLTIITQTSDSEKAIKLIINWNDYKIDSNLVKIQNAFEYVEKTQEKGTTLIIEDLREWWSEASIIRIYRYVSDLLQPDYISDRSEELSLARQEDESFKVQFKQTLDDQEKIVADPDRMIFKKALAVIEGYVDKNHDGYCMLTSNSLDVPNDLIEVHHNKIYNNEEEKDKKYRNLNELHFKLYYFVYQREKYYTNISKIELANIQRIANEQGGIRLYRNGFRVLPYGEPDNDWLDIDRRYSSVSGATNIPFGNKNLFGFVEIIDPSGNVFEETASREGLIDNDAYKELADFVHKALEAARDRLRYGIEKIKKEIESINNKPQNDIFKESEKTTFEKLDDLSESVNRIINSDSASPDTKSLKISTQKIVEELKFDFQRLLDELGMLRVLAGLGLTIGEFTHEVVQFSPSLMGDLSVLSNQSLKPNGIKSLENLKRTIQLFTSYTSYFNATVSANVSRELKPQNLDVVIEHFKNIVLTDLQKLNIDLKIETFGYDLLTIPMHSSEWSSILFNLYTNSKKAIKRNSVKGKIKIVSGKEEKKVYIEFSDNGDGIPEQNKQKVFEAFFTTSSPIGFDAAEDEKLTGTGLGLKIVKDIVQTYGGIIEIIDPETGYTTCFRIELPLATEKQKEEYATKI